MGELLNHIGATVTKDYPSVVRNGNTHQGFPRVINRRSMPESLRVGLWTRVKHEVSHRRVVYHAFLGTDMACQRLGHTHQVEVVAAVAVIAGDVSWALASPPADCAYAILHYGS